MLPRLASACSRSVLSPAPWPKRDRIISAPSALSTIISSRFAAPSTMSGLVEYGSSDEEDANQQVSQPPEALKVRNFKSLAGRFSIKLLTVQMLGP